MAGYMFKVFDAVRPAEEVIEGVGERYKKNFDSTMKNIDNNFDHFIASIQSKLDNYTEIKEHLIKTVTSTKEKVQKILEETKNTFIENFNECSGECMFHLNMADENIYFIMETNISCQENEFIQTVQDWIDRTLDEIYTELKKCIRIPTVAVLTATNELTSQFGQIETGLLRLFKKIEKDLDEKLPDNKDEFLKGVDHSANKFTEQTKEQTENALRSASDVLATAQSDLNTACTSASEKAQIAIDCRIR